MPNAAFPEIDTLTPFLSNAVAKVMHTMAQMNAKFVKRLDADPTCKNPCVKLGFKDPVMAGTVGFIGEANGVVYLYLEAELAAQIAAKITGMTPGELMQEDNAEIVRDVVAEVTNMTVGTFKNAICDLGFQSKVTLPTVLRGSQLEVESIASAKRWSFEFEVMNRPFGADLFIKDENSG